MECSNCFNGCLDITSDKCVKYTGLTIDALGITNGDSLSSVENAITTYLQSALNGTGIKLDIASNIICQTISKYIPTNTDTTLVDITTALVKGVCDLQTELTAVSDIVDTFNNDYYTACLTDVNSSSGTHLILQSVITYLCGLSSTVDGLATDLSSNYVAIADINTYIAQYIEGLVSSPTAYSSRMVPYTAVEFYGDVSGKFDSSGAGLGDWSKVYLCNGQNGTPDKRGRIAVGVTNVSGGGVFDTEVDPGITGNPTYVLNTKTGTNSVVLLSSNLPSHTHTNTAISTVDATAHRHKFSDNVNQNAVRADNDISLVPGTPPYTAISGAGIGGGKIYYTSATAPVTTVTTAVTIAATGGNAGHSNIQPVLACNYIIYIP